MARTASILLLLTSCALLAQRIQPADLWSRPTTAPDKKLAYGQDPLQFAELRLPKSTGPVPVVVLIHGGCWVDRLPTRDPRDTTLEPLRPLAAALTEAGLATWNIEYRRAGNPGGGWPGSFNDISTALDFLRTISKTHNLDLNRIVVVGHSAGGQLAHWVASRPKLPKSSPLHSANPLPVKAIVNVDGPPDLTTAHPMEQQFCPVTGITQFMGGTPSEHPGRYREASASLPTGVPQTIVSGALLQMASPLVTTYETSAKAKGDTIQILQLKGAGHFDMLAPDSPHGKSLIEAILALAR
jgi:acetyl esterase/lipase